MHNKIILILFLIIIFLLFINIETVKNTFFFDNDANYQYNLDAVETSQCNTYDCSNEVPINSQEKIVQKRNIPKINASDNILLVGDDKDKNPVFKYKDNFYKLNNNIQANKWYLTYYS